MSPQWFPSWFGGREPLSGVLHGDLTKWLRGLIVGQVMARSNRVGRPIPGLSNLVAQPAVNR